jgi:hypothetical protein
VSKGGNWRTGVCGQCGRDGPIAKVATDAHPDLCGRCYLPHQPRRECGICGRVRPIRNRARDGQPDICGSCQPVLERPCGACGRVGRIALAATAERPALGKCCYQPPPATCTECGRERPCVGARGPTPLCSTCNHQQRTKTCLDCGEPRPAARRVDGGVICGACDRRRGGTRGGCRDCGTPARLVTGRCPACRLLARIAALREHADPAAAATLEPFLAALAAAPNSDSMLRWLHTPSLALLEGLLDGKVEITHTGLDGAVGDVASARTVAFLRRRLVHHGVLERRDEHSIEFAHWLAHATAEIPSGPDRGHVRAYATWHVAHNLARRSGRTSWRDQKYARALVGEAIKLVLWLDAQGLALRDLRQDILDTWITDGATPRRLVRLFLAWLERRDVTPPLDIAWNTPGPPQAPLDDQVRFAVLRRLLHDQDADPRDRLAGCLLLLYAQPLTRTAALRTTDVAVTPAGQTTITLARGAIVLPEPLGAIALALRDQGLTATGEGWLMPGYKPGDHLSAERLRERLKPFGIPSRPGRHAALLALGARLPAPVLAERLGFDQSRAAQWVRAAGGTYAEYVALRTQ